MTFLICAQKPKMTIILKLNERNKEINVSMNTQLHLIIIKLKKTPSDD